MLICLFRRVKTLLITTSNNIKETRLQTTEIKKTSGFLISIRLKKKRILTSTRDSPRPLLASPLFMVIFTSAEYDLRIL